MGFGKNQSIIMMDRSSHLQDGHILGIARKAKEKVSVIAHVGEGAMRYSAVM